MEKSWNFVFEFLWEPCGSFAFIVLRISCYCKGSVAFPHDVVGWSGVYDCCFS